MARNVGPGDIQISNPHYDGSPFTGRRELNPRHGTKGHSYDDSGITLVGVVGRGGSEGIVQV